MRISRKKNQIILKVVYYGPGLSGKTSNLNWLHSRLPEARRGRMIKLDTATERTLFFDYLPFEYGSTGSYTIKIDFFTVPGQSFYHTTRDAVLDGADGIVFVADSDRDREEANLLAHADMVASLHSRKRSLSTVPHVYQWNKRDVPRALPTPLLERLLNPEGSPSFEAMAVHGEGVLETQSALVTRILDHVTV